MKQDEIEIFGMKIKMVEGNADSCSKCIFNDFYSECPSFKGVRPCGNNIGYFVEI